MHSLTTAPRALSPAIQLSAYPERDIHAALKQWVEGGAAPAWIVATKYKSPGVVERTRPLCPYPQTAHYKGSGSTDDAANFLCR